MESISTKRIIWPIGSMIVFAVLVNAIIIAMASMHLSNLFWLLLLTIPLLVAGVLNAKRTIHILNKYRDIKQRAVQSKVKCELLSHSINSNTIGETDLNVLIGNDQCSQPYNALVFDTCSIEDFDPEKANVVTVIDRRPICPNIPKNSLRTYSLGREDLVWQIGPTYIGCRTPDDNFSSKVFKENATLREVKMIELMLSTPISSMYFINSFLNNEQKNNPQINNSIFSSSSFSTFRDAEGMIHFLDTLRQLSGKKPIGIRLQINDKKEFREICHAICKTQLIPDFIVVEGSSESNSAIHKGMPLYEALLFVSQTLQMYGLETKIKIIASGKIITSFDILKALALGADAVSAEMTGYIQYDGKTFLLYKDQNRDDFRNNLLKEVVQAMKACDFVSVNDITLPKLFRRLDIFLESDWYNFNKTISYSPPVKKVYASKTKSHQILDA